MKRYCDMLADERPEYKAANYGFESLSNTELLSMVINRGAGTIESMSQARQLMNVASGSLTALGKMSMYEMQVVQGTCHTRSLGTWQAQGDGEARLPPRPWQQHSHLQLPSPDDGRPASRGGAPFADEPKLQAIEARQVERGGNHRHIGGRKTHHA